MTESSLRMESVSKTFQLPDGQQLTVLSGLDMAVNYGEVVAVVGKSGSGKSTLLNILGLLDTPTNGQVLIDGLPTSQLGDTERARMRGASIGFIFQQFFLMDHRTALENVAEPMLYGTRTDMRTRYERGEQLLRAVGLPHRLNSLPTVLSGGEQQRVAIARALVRGPKIVLADEPTGALDADTSDVVLDLLIGVARDVGTTLIIVTHDTDVAARADRTVVLEHGVLRNSNA